ncbi:MAG: hypothetical protein WA383_04945 [Terriglobales bacterium]|jgi:hypothetical protein
MLPQKAAARMFEHLQAIEQPEATAGTLPVRAYSPWTGEVRKGHEQAMVWDSFPQYQALAPEFSRAARIERQDIERQD